MGCPAPIPAAEQKDIFDSVLQESMTDDCSYSVVSGIRDRICDLLEENRESKTEEPLMISKSTMHNLLNECNVPEDKINSFDDKFEEAFGKHARICPHNIISTKQLEVKTPDVTVKVNPDRSDLVKTEVIDGVKYILIRAEDGVEVNGVDINII